MPAPDPLAPLIDDPGRAAVLSDFDGSLAPIVDDPSSARPLPGTVEVLARLGPLVRLVGIVSGRPVSFLRRVLPVEAVVLAGLYGMERVVDGEVRLDPRVADYVGVAEQAATELERALPDLYVERKGRVACVVHWRRSPAREDEAVALAGEVARRHGLSAERGRMALELRPPVEVDKGTVVESLSEGVRVVLFAGDDTGDLAAFDALDRMVGEGSLGAAVKVAVASEEAPRELLERADARVEGPAELVHLLGGLASALDG